MGLTRGPLRWTALAAVLIVGCGDGRSSEPAAAPDERGQAAAAKPDPPPDRPTGHAAAAQRTVDDYLYALTDGDEDACDFLTEEFMGRIARANANTTGGSDIWRLRCEAHARDLIDHGERTLSRGAITAERASPSEATVTASITVADAADSSYDSGTPPEAAIDATYHLTRADGRWRIAEITEDSLDEYGGGDGISSPISADFGGNLVLVRGCAASAKSYCDPLFPE
jgi:hypothetical protein